MISYKFLSSTNSTGTFDVRNVTVMNIENGRVCLSVEYVEGHVESASSFILFRCSTTAWN